MERPLLKDVFQFGFGQPQTYEDSVYQEAPPDR